VTRVAVVSFACGHTRLCLAADAVLALEPPDAAVPHVGHLLALLPGERSGQRVLLLEGGARVRVDGPIKMEEVGGEDILPAPCAMPPRLPVLGYAGFGDGVMVLLDVPALLASAPHAEGGVT